MNNNVDGNEDDDGVEGGQFSCFPAENSDSRPERVYIANAKKG